MKLHRLISEEFSTKSFQKSTFRKPFFVEFFDLIAINDISVLSLLKKNQLVLPGRSSRFLEVSCFNLVNVFKTKEFRFFS